MACLITLDDLKTLWGIAKDDVAADAMHRLLIAQCSARIETYCRRVFAAAAYTEYYQGSGDKYLVLRQRPILDDPYPVVYEDQSGNWGQGSDPFAAATLLVAETDYVIVREGGDSGKSGMLYRVTGVWPKPQIYTPGIISPQAAPAVGNIKITYTAGYATIPGDIAQACAYLCGVVKRTIVHGQPTVSESWEDYSVAFANAAAASIGGLPPDVLGILAAYRNPSIG